MFKKLFKDEKGSAITELALTLPLIITLAFGYIFYMNAVEDHIVMQTAAREAARVYANPVEDEDMKSKAIGVANRELSANGVKGARVEAYADGFERYVLIEKPYSTRFPLNRYNLEAGAVFHTEPFDPEVEE